MTSSEIRQSFLDFFESKQHSIVPSSSLLPDSPNLLFTNAGMNQFVPIFLGQTKCPYNPGRAADTQKCIRAGGKHNDLDDVGLDTYHHTFFEMLGNWSFGDYFKQEAIAWAWELVVEIWKFPPPRLYATVYAPDKSQEDPSEFDQEAWDHWAEKFRSVGLDPAVHIVRGGKRDNFWMMGETGPCGPCSELHVDLTPQGETRGALVNQGDARCIEIWNLVFIQFNADADGAFSPLPARHVDTGLGFERVTGIMQGTKNFTDFEHAKISNYETDIFRPLFDKLAQLSGRNYRSTLPAAGTAHATEQEKIDIAFRVIADHIRTLSFAVADGIQPGNTGRNYVLRRILRRAVRYGRLLGFHEPFFYKLVEVLADTMGDVFPEIREKRRQVETVVQQEEEAFNKTLDRGIEMFNEEVARLSGGQREVLGGTGDSPVPLGDPPSGTTATSPLQSAPQAPGAAPSHSAGSVAQRHGQVARATQLSAQFAFKLYDTYGFPIDLTELMARERGFTVDIAGFKQLMEEQRERGRKSQKKEIIELSQVETTTPTQFIGYDTLETPARVLEVISLKDKTAVILDTSTCYAELGGQVGDAGELTGGGQLWRIVNTQKSGQTWLHFLDTDPHAPPLAPPAETAVDAPLVGATVHLSVDRLRRLAIQRHHTVTHLLHWALHEVVSREAAQKGSFVGPDKLTFDFNSAPLTPQQLADLEKLVNERILENAAVTWTETPYAAVKSRKDVMQFFGDKYGDNVRVVQIGGHVGQLDGYSMELCGGTHARATGEIGLFRIVGESAIAAGVRRLEAVAGLEAYRQAAEDLHRIKTLAGKVNSPLADLEKKLEMLLAHQKELEKQLKASQQREASSIAAQLKSQGTIVNGIPAILYNLGTADADLLQSVADALKSSFKGVIVLGGVSQGAVALVAAVSPEYTAKVQAGKIIQAIAPIVGGKGGGKPDNARGGGKDPSQLAEALVKAKMLLG